MEVESGEVPKTSDFDDFRWISNGVVQMASLGFSRNPPEEWMSGGIIILTRETKIAEMKFSEPS